MRFLVFFIFSMSVLQLAAQQNISVIPQPSSVKAGEGFYRLTKKTKIYYNQHAYRKALFFANILRKSTGYKLPLLFSEKPVSTGINFFAFPESGNERKEDYELEVNPEMVLLKAIDSAGIFNGVQTLRQLLPASVESSRAVKAENWIIPSVTIKDSPRFAWRGYMKDVSRTFYSVDVVKKYLDAMALYKLNVFHFHLTDDQGWRIEIKKYPELTTPKTTIFDAKHNQPAERSGFYTQSQIKELIAYAAERNITIVPEIDVPGHCWPIILTHPELGVNKMKSPDYVFPFLASWSYWGYQFTPNPLDPTKEEVYTFLNDVFEEVATLFPSEYIHFGGDEVVHRLWESEPQVQAFMKEKGYTKIEEVQSYFVSRISEIIKAKGKKPMGWNDILEGADNLTKETAIMAWLGDEAVKKAASNGFYVVATPSAPLYFDITQNNRHDGTVSDLAYGNINTIDKVYNYDPVQSLEPSEEKYVLGIQANQWPAVPQEVKDINVQNFPRLLALAEAAWTPANEKNFADFSKRLDSHYPRLDRLKIDYFRIGGYIAGTWEPKQVSTDFTPIEWDVTKKIYANGRIIAGLFYTSGESFLKIKSIQLLENGKVISEDIHDGLADTYRGTSKPKTFLYHLKVDNYKPKAKYTVKAVVAGHTNADSFGNFTFNLSPYEPFTVVESSK